MKTNIAVLASALFLTIATFAQKDELKSLKKIHERTEISDKDITEFKSVLTKTDALISASDSEKGYFQYYKSVTPYLEYLVAMSKSVNKDNPALVSQFLNAKNINDLVTGRNTILTQEKKDGASVVTKTLTDNAAALKAVLVNYAVALNEKEQYKDASLILKSVYELDPKDAEKLYYAANFALNAKDYDLALSEYKELKRINFTGEATQYFAFNKETKKEDFFNSKSERDLYVKATSHEKPREEKIPSKRGEIVKNIALILIQSGKKEEAISAIQDARASSPEDMSLMMTEANLYYELKDIKNYERVIKEAIEKNPADAELYFNLGVTSSNSKNTADAEKYFKKAIELKPDYADAYINMSELKLRDDEKFVNDMSKLGTSAADQKKYDIIKASRSKMFSEAMPFLEKAYELDPKNEAVAKTLLSVYRAMEMNEKAKALKAKM